MTFEAVLLIGLVIAVTEFVKRVAPTLPSWATPVVALIVGVGATFLVGESDYASTQLIGGIALDDANAYSKLIAGILIGVGGAAGIAVPGIRGVANIGENTTKGPVD
jgi:hypothetical protein